LAGNALHGDDHDEAEEARREEACQCAEGTGEAAGKARLQARRLEAMLRRPDGATIEQLSKALDWQAHSVRGAMSGALKKTMQGLSVASEKREDGTRVYRIAA
jgi:hypothetical protein